VALLLFPTCTDVHGAKEKPRAETIVQKDSHEAEFERMSDEELIKAIAERANKLGIKINLRYDFGSGRSDDAQ
jgi:purine-nucleoside phosphorylase